LRPLWQAFRIAKTTLSVSWEADDVGELGLEASSSRLGEPPEASRITGALVYPRIAATRCRQSRAARRMQHHLQ